MQQIAPPHLPPPLLAPTQQGFSHTHRPKALQVKTQEGRREDTRRRRRRRRAVFPHTMAGEAGERGEGVGERKRERERYTRTDTLVHKAARRGAHTKATTRHDRPLPPRERCRRQCRQRRVQEARWRGTGSGGASEWRCHASTDEGAPMQEVRSAGSRQMMGASQEADTCRWQQTIVGRKRRREAPTLFGGCAHNTPTRPVRPYKRGKRYDVNASHILDKHRCGHRCVCVRSCFNDDTT